MTSEGKFNSGEVPVFVTDVSLHGIRKTNSDFIKRQLVDLVRSRNLSELLKSSADLKELLMNLNIFNSVEFSIDTGSDSLHPDAYKVGIHVNEKTPQTLKAQWWVNTDGAMRLGGHYSINNILGKAEQLQLDLCFGRDAYSLRSARFVKPVERNPSVFFSVGGSEGSYEHWWSRFTRHEKSIFAEVTAPTRLGLHKLLWSTVWRELSTSDTFLPWNVHLESGHSLRTGLRHQLELDTRPDRIFPDRGFLLNFTQDLTYITPSPPDTRSRGLAEAILASGPERDHSIQLRMDSVLQWPIRFTSWLVGELTFSAGLVHSLTSNSVSIADRFFLGGPLGLRGFKFCALAPSEPLLVPKPIYSESNLIAQTPAFSNTNEAAAAPPCLPVGALGSWLAGGHLYSPLPLCSSTEGTIGSLFRLHAFAMAGSLVTDPVGAVKRAQSSGDTGFSRLIELMDIQPRYVLGAGLILRFAQMARLEVNYCLPMASQPGDAAQPGFQIGVGISYM